MSMNVKTKMKTSKEFMTGHLDALLQTAPGHMPILACGGETMAGLGREGGQGACPLSSVMQRS